MHKAKKNAKREIERYKTRLLAKGYKQQQDIDYDEIFVLVTHLETIRLIISLATQNNWKIFQIDIKSDFIFYFIYFSFFFYIYINGHFEEEVYVEQPIGCLVKEHENKFLK